jgi:raffinose/stachyose/melibiose transport system substrate-binding protein
MNKGFKFFILLIVAIVGLSVGVVSAQDAVTINWWHISTADAQKAYWQGLADAYTADHPNVTINITVLANDPYKQRLTSVMQSNDPPDLFQSWGGGVLWAYAQAGLVRNIAPELEGAWKDSFSAQAALELYGQNGEYYGVPWDWGAVGMYYNKTLFTQAGLDPANPPANWTDFLAAVQKLKDAGITPISLGEKDEWPGAFWWEYLAIRMGGQDAFLNAYNGTGSFADAPFVAAGDKLKELVDLNAFPDGYLGLTWPNQENIFGDGKAAMELQGQWEESGQKDNSTNKEGIGDALGWFPFPAVEGGAGNATDVLGGGNGIAVGANAPDAAVDFLKFLTSSDSQRLGADPAGAAGGFFMPTVTGLQDLSLTDPVKASIIQARDGATYFQLYYDQFMSPTVGNAVNDAVATIFAGTGSSQDAAQAIQDAYSAEMATPSS